MEVAVVMPLILLLACQITPAPKKPMPVTMFEAILSGLCTPIFSESSVNRQAPKLTRIKVLRPADLFQYSLSAPIIRPIITDNNTLTVSWVNAESIKFAVYVQN